MIINSSLVGITQTDTLLPAIEIRGPFRICRFVQFDAKWAEPLANGLAERHRVLSNARREHEGVQPAKNGGIVAPILEHLIDECIQSPALPPPFCFPGARACRY